MAASITNKKLFVSSTVHDLGPYREALFGALQRRGFAVLLSEKGKLDIDDEKHTYLNCIKNAIECDYLIAMIGARFGGTLPEEPGVSITIAEIRAARAAGKPVFVFVHRKVFEARLVYKRYMKQGQPFLPIPGIVEKEDVLKFVDEWTAQETGNWYHQFETPDDVLKIFCDQLERRGDPFAPVCLVQTKNTLDELSSTIEKVDGDIRFMSQQPHASVLKFFDSEILWSIIECHGKIMKLAKGEVHYEGEECLVKTGECFSHASGQVSAVSFPDGSLWNAYRTQAYLSANERALLRQVPITRYFVLGEEFLADETERSLFMQGIRHHFDLRERTTKNGEPYYTIKLVQEDQVNLPKNTTGKPDIPDVSFFDGLIVSEWGAHPRSPTVSYSRIYLAIGNEKKKIDTVFLALENAPAHSVSNTSEVQHYFRRRLRH